MLLLVWDLPVEDVVLWWGPVVRVRAGDLVVGFDTPVGLKVEGVIHAEGAEDAGTGLQVRGGSRVRGVAWNE